MALTAAKKLTGRNDFARLASNENCNGCSPKVSAALAQGLDPWRYADPSCTELREEIATRFSVKSDYIVAGNGSDDIAAPVTLFNALTEKGFRVATSHANFLFIDVGRDSEQVAFSLLKKGIIVKPWKEEG